MRQVAGSATNEHRFKLEKMPQAGGCAGFSRAHVSDEEAHASSCCAQVLLRFALEIAEACLEGMWLRSRRVSRKSA